MPAGLQRLYGQNHLHFITFSCYRRMPLLKSARARDVFVQELARLRARTGFQLIGYVVMPEHVHLLVSEPPRGTPSDVVRDLKLRTARRLRRRGRKITGQRELPFGEPNEPRGGLWQARFYDFNVYTDRKKREKLEYMPANPITRGLVTHPKDWPWSSWSKYARRGEGLIPVDLL
jgi:putative transposase